METRSLEAIKIDHHDVMGRAKASLSGRYGTPIAVLAIIIVVSIIAQAIPYLSAVTFILSGPLSLGLAFFYLKMSRDQAVEMEDVKFGFDHFGNALGTYLLMMIAILLGFICFIIPGIILSLGLSMTYWIIAEDPSIPPMDALKKSWAMMKGHKLDLFVLGLRFIPWAILCIFTLFIGYLWLLPYMQVTYANYYRALTNDNGGELDIMDHFVV